MSKPSQLLDSINQNLIRLNNNQLNMIAKQSETHTMVKQLRKDVDGHENDIEGLKESNFKRIGGWQMLILIGSALLSVSAIVATFIK